MPDYHRQIFHSIWHEHSIKHAAVWWFPAKPVNKLRVKQSTAEVPKLRSYVLFPFVFRQKLFETVTSCFVGRFTSKQNTKLHSVLFFSLLPIFNVCLLLPSVWSSTVLHCEKNLNPRHLLSGLDYSIKDISTRRLYLSDSLSFWVISLAGLKLCDLLHNFIKVNCDNVDVPGPEFGNHRWDMKSQFLLTSLPDGELSHFLKGQERV